MGAVAVAVAAQWAAGQSVEGIVAEGLRVARRAKRAGGSTVTTGIATRRPRPGQPVLLVVAEELVIRALRQGRIHRADVAHRVVAQALVVERRPIADPAQRRRSGASVVIELGRSMIERRARALPDSGAGDRPQCPRCARVADRRQQWGGDAVLRPGGAREPPPAVSRSPSNTTSSQEDIQLST